VFAGDLGVVSQVRNSSCDKDILPMSAMAMDSGGRAPPAGFQETVLPSAETETLPSCFLY
jgi:hypothetical protein